MDTKASSRWTPRRRWRPSVHSQPLTFHPKVLGSGCEVRLCFPDTVQQKPKSCLVFCLFLCFLFYDSQKAFFFLYTLLPNSPHLVVFSRCRHQERVLGKTRHRADKVCAPGDDCRMWMMDGKAEWRCGECLSEGKPRRENKHAERKSMVEDSDVIFSPPGLVLLTDAAFLPLNQLLCYFT